MSDTRDPLCGVKQLSDPLRSFTWLLVALAVFLPLTNLRLLSVALSSSCLLLAVALLVAPPGTPNAIYLRAFRSDSSTAKLRLQLAALLGPKFRLSGIRPPRERTSTFVRYLLPYWFALRYAGSNSMELEAGEEWIARLWKTYQHTRLVFIDMRDLTPYVHQEITLTLDAMGADRCILLVDDLKTPTEWRQVIANNSGLNLDLQRLKLLDVGSASMAMDLKAMVAALPPGTAGVTERGRQYVLDHVDEGLLRESKRAWPVRLLGAAVALILLVVCPIFWGPLVLILQPLFLPLWMSGLLILAVFSVPISRAAARTVRVAAAGHRLAAARGFAVLALVLVSLTGAVALGPRPYQTLSASGLNALLYGAPETGPAWLSGAHPNQAPRRSADILSDTTSDRPTPEMQQDEAVALLALNRIHDAEAYYRRRHPADGFVCSLVALQPDTAGYSPGAYVGSNLATGQSAGYKFDFVNCSQSTVKHRLVFADYEVVAVPTEPGVSGQSGYCLYTDGSIRKDPSGGKNCTESVQAAKD